MLQRKNKNIKHQIDMPPSLHEDPEVVSLELITTSFISGGFAGVVCDLSLYPIDTVKTRLQSKQGFLKVGGFRGLYRGLGACMLGSIPNASSFFIAYDSSKVLLPKVISSSDVYIHTLAGAIGEIAATSAKMPFEVVKQTTQAGGDYTSRTAFLHIIKNNGFRGLYTGYFSTLYRDVPYTTLQMPIWEYLKVKVATYYQQEPTALQSGICAQIAAAISAAITTPFDVAKTRIILSNPTDSDYTENPFRVMYRIFRQEGFLKLFSGIVPRVIWISTGGLIFFSAYEFAKPLCLQRFSSEHQISVL